MQITLRVFLILICVVGITIGLSSRTFNENPQRLFHILSWAIYIVPLVLAVGTLFALGIRRRITWQPNACASCQHRLDGGAQLTACPQCGNDLTQPTAVVLERTARRQPRLLVWTCVILLMPMLGQPIVTRLQRQGSGGFSFMSTSRLIKTQLSTKMHHSGIWRELERRIDANELTDEQINEVIQALVADLQNNPGSRLTWQRRFVEKAQPRLSDEAKISLCDAILLSPPRLDQTRRFREKQYIDLSISYGDPFAKTSAAPGDLIWRVTDVAVDGQSVDCEGRQLGNRWYCKYFANDLARGEHELTFTLDCAYLPRPPNSRSSLRKIPEDWSGALKRWTTTFTAPVRVYGSQEPLVTLVTNEARRPTQGGLRNLNLDIVRSGEETNEVLLKFDYDTELEIPICYDVYVTFGGPQRIHLGRAVWASSERRTNWSPRRLLKGKIPSLDSAVDRATVFLTPNPDYLDDDLDVHEIWGIEEKIRNVPVNNLNAKEKNGAEAARALALQNPHVAKLASQAQRK